MGDLFGVVLTVGLQWLVGSTRFGAQLRASVDNPRVARGLGINVDRVFTLTFALGSALAGLGGALGIEISRLSLSAVAISIEGSAPGIQALEGLAERLRGQGWDVQSDTPGLTPEGRPRFLLKGTAAHEG